MKRIALFTLLLFACSIGFAQDETMMDIVIVMKAQYNRTELCRKADFLATRAERRDYVVKELKTFTEASQYELKGVLGELEKQGLVSSVQSLWSANTLYFKATASVMAILSERDDIAYIGPMKRYPLIPDAFACIIRGNTNILYTEHLSILLSEVY